MVKGTAIAKFWSAVVKPGTVLRTGNKLKFKNHAAKWGWDGEIDTLYVRQCYEEAVETINVKNRIVVQGTPGIGKSIFIFYLLYALVRQAREKGLPIPTFEIADQNEKRYFLTVVGGNGVVTTEGDTPDIIITDAVGRPVPGCKEKYIHVSSLYNKNLKDVLNNIATRSDRAIITFPVFSRDEYLDSDGTTYSTVCLHWL